MDEQTRTTLITIFSGAFLVGGFGYLIVVTLSYWLKCPRCSIRIASVKAGNVATIGTNRFNEIGSDTFYSNEKVCERCWDQLAEKDFPKGGLWWPGATVAYLKNTPTTITVLISFAALLVAIFALLK